VSQPDTAAEPVLVEHRSDKVSVVTLNRPERLNASNAAMTYALLEALAESDKQPDTNVIVLTGAGRAFCAGGDTNNMGGEPTGWDDVHHRDWHLSHALLSVEKPTIAMVNGAAVGLGLTMALFCDLVFVAEEAKLGDTHVNIGLVAGDGAAVTIPLLIGPQRAKALMLGGTLITGAEAARLGLVNRAVPRADLERVTWETATRIAAQPPYAARATKMVVNRYVRWMWQEVMEFALAAEQISVAMPEHKAAIERYRTNRAAPAAGPVGKDR
jgi:enoyl-CoA hydratase